MRYRDVPPRVINVNITVEREQDPAAPLGTPSGTPPPPRDATPLSEFHDFAAAPSASIMEAPPQAARRALHPHRNSSAQQCPPVPVTSTATAHDMRALRAEPAHDPWQPAALPTGLARRTVSLHDVPPPPAGPSGETATTLAVTAPLLSASAAAPHSRSSSAELSMASARATAAPGGGVPPYAPPPQHGAVSVAGSPAAGAGARWEPQSPPASPASPGMTPMYIAVPHSLPAASKSISPPRPPLPGSVSLQDRFTRRRGVSLVVTPGTPLPLFATSAATSARTATPAAQQQQQQQQHSVRWEREVTLVADRTVSHQARPRQHTMPMAPAATPAATPAGRAAFPSPLFTPKGVSVTHFH